MWTGIPTPSAELDCAPPFSFFFDLVEPYLKAPDRNDEPLHRLCTLARKQGGSSLTVECALADAAVREEIAALDVALGRGGSAEAVRITYLAPAGDLEDRSSIRVLSQVTIINYRAPGAEAFTHSYVFQAIVASPRICAADGSSHPLLNNFVYSEGALQCRVGDKVHNLHGMHFFQQNGVTHVCAHAALRMALTSSSNAISPAYINTVGRVRKPASGMKVEHILRVIDDQGLHAQVFEAEKLEHQQIISTIASIVESGDQALLVFTTGDTVQDGDEEILAEHVVLVVGHTRHTDEWHPQAIRDYSGNTETPFYRASDWIDHLLIHDDNFGPYYTLSSHALEFSKKVKARHIIGIRRRPTNLPPPVAELLAALTLFGSLPDIAPISDNRWIKYLSRTGLTPVLRPLLVSRSDYIDHLRHSKGHDGSAVQESELEQLAVLPDHFWMVEFSLPALFTGNHSKLGEVLIASEVSSDRPPPDQNLELGMRVAGLFLLPSAADSGKLAPRPFGLKSHSPILRLSDEITIW